LDELLKTKQSADLLEESHFKGCEPIFSQLRTSADQQIDKFRLEFNDSLLRLAQEVNLPLKVDFPRFSVLKGIEGKFDFVKRTTVVNQVTLKSINPKRIVPVILNLKRKLYDSAFEPQLFIDSLLACYKEILKKNNQGPSDGVPILQLYTDYVWSLQSQAFFQNMDKGKFKGYSVDQFAVDFWRFFQSGTSSAAGGYRIRLNPGRNRSLWLIDQDGERRQITHAIFTKL
jgi:hypothetical protein